MRLPELPPSLWTRSALELIVSKTGKLVRFDQSLELLSKGSFARVAIELDLSKPLLPGTVIQLDGLFVSRFGNPSCMKIFIFFVVVVPVLVIDLPIALHRWSPPLLFPLLCRMSRWPEGTRPLPMMTQALLEETGCMSAAVVATLAQHH